MSAARTALRHSDTPLAKIADHIRYLSDSAFSFAFKRATEMSLGRFRTAHTAVADGEGANGRN
jgi:AraC-like DNA-binding protein